MTSERQREANRANAKKSTGPKSPRGKCRVSQNAYQHGLSVRASFAGERAAELEQLTREITESTEGQIRRSRAREIAEAELDVRRVRAVEAAIVKQIFACSKRAQTHVSLSAGTSVGENFSREAGALEQAITMTAKLDRYQRRAAARLARAIRNAFEGGPIES